jgi:uncharacterized membrane protein
VSAVNSSQPVQPSTSISASLAVWLFLSLLALAIVSAVVSAPIAVTQGHIAFAATIYKTFSYLCHQIPERSFHLAGHPFAVCSRCTGLYAGFAFATLALPLVRSLKQTDTPRVIWLFLSAVPLAIDFGLTYFGVWENNHFTRVTTGALFGAVAAIYVVPGLIELNATIRRHSSLPRGQNHLR